MLLDVVLRRIDRGARSPQRPKRTRPASIGPVKHLIRRVDLDGLRQVIDDAMAQGEINLRRSVTEWLARQSHS